MRHSYALAVLGLSLTAIGCGAKSASAGTGGEAFGVADRDLDGVNLGIVEDDKEFEGQARRTTSFCSETSKLVVKSCKYQAAADYLLAKGRCLGLSDPEEKKVCTAEARAAFEEAIAGCREQREFRKDLCEEIGEDIYDPEIDPSNFLEKIDNPLFPLKIGSRMVYQKKSDEGTETTEVVVTSDKREILGVRCTVVRDTVKLGAELVEDTLDFFAQDAEGNVWYFGERSHGFENGDIVSLAGSWEAGVDGAKPGIIMKAHPRPGDLYRQELFLGEAEDMARVLSVDERVSVPFGNFTGCLETEDFTPLEPGAIERKLYAPGVGLVLEVDPDTGLRTELIEATGL